MPSHDGYSGRGRGRAVSGIPSTSTPRDQPNESPVDPSSAPTAPQAPPLPPPPMFRVFNEFVEVVFNEGVKTVKRPITARMGELIVQFCVEGVVKAHRWEISSLKKAVPEIAPYIRFTPIILVK